VYNTEHSINHDRKTVGRTHWSYELKFEGHFDQSLRLGIPNNRPFESEGISLRWSPDLIDTNILVNFALEFRNIDCYSPYIIAREP
jgi:hypothetical protein